MYLFCKRLEDRIPSFMGDLDVDRRLHPLVCVESTLPKGLPIFGTPHGGNDHGYLVCNYQLPTRAVGMRFATTLVMWSLPAYTFGRNGGTHWWWRKEETTWGGTNNPHAGCFLLTFHPPLKAKRSSLCRPTMIATSL